MPAANWRLRSQSVTKNRYLFFISKNNRIFAEVNLKKEKYGTDSKQ
jgi:hypothetical protein